MKTTKNLLLYVIAGLVVWLGLNGGTSWPVVAPGVVLSLIIFFMSNRSLFDDVKLSPKAAIAGLVWLFVFFIALIKSNIDVISRVLSPRLPINPGIVTVKTRLKSRLGRLALANSITLTPGTLTVDVKDDRLYVHWIDVTATDVNAATAEIVAKFETHLEKMFG